MTSCRRLLLPWAFLLVMGATATLAQEQESFPEVALDEEAVFRGAGFTDQTIALMAWCPIYTAFAHRVHLLGEIQRPLAPDKVQKINRGVDSCVRSPIFELMNQRFCAQTLCNDLIVVFELPVRRILSPRAQRAREEKREQAKKTQDEYFTTLAAALVLLFTLAAMALERRMRGGRSSR